MDVRVGFLVFSPDGEGTHPDLEECRMAETKTEDGAAASAASLLEYVSGIGQRYRLSAIVPRLEACAALLQDGDAIDVGVLGRFKAGKSTLMNHLCGRAVLPVGVTPVTAVITRIRYGPAEKAIVRYLDGRRREVPVDDVRLYVAEADNPANKKKVASVTVDLPSMQKYRGLQFVDTPGLDSIFQHNTEAALAWLPKVGLALVTISVDPPLSRHDLELIRTLRDYTPRIAIVLTKVDLLSEEERDEVAAFVGRQLQEEFSTEFRIFPFSVRPGYEALQERFVSGLLHPLHRDRDGARSEILRFKLASLVNQTRDYLAIALAAAERADADRQTLWQQILDEQTNFDSIRMELIALGRELAGRTRPWIMKRMEELRAQVQGRVSFVVGGGLSAARGNLWKLTREFERLLRECMAREMSAISEQEGELFCRPLHNAAASFTRAVQGFRDRLAGNIRKALGMQFDPEPFEVELEKPARPNISISSPFMFDIDLLWFVIPMAIFRPWIEKRLMARIEPEVEKNMSRLASQWTEAVNTRIAALEAKAVRTVQEQILTVEALLSKTGSEAEQIRRDIGELEARRAALPA
jgi:signal recognition particle receptor subunit beta